MLGQSSYDVAQWSYDIAQYSYDIAQCSYDVAVLFVCNKSRFCHPYPNFYDLKVVSPGSIIGVVSPGNSRSWKKIVGFLLPRLTNPVIGWGTGYILLIL
jgi:hypothetical protein